VAVRQSSLTDRWPAVVLGRRHDADPERVDLRDVVMRAAGRRRDHRTAAGIDLNDDARVGV
jgi:hypothetical protein